MRQKRLKSTDAGSQELAARPHQFRDLNEAQDHMIVVPSASSERRYYLPVGQLDAGCVVSNLAFAIYDGPIWTIGLIASRLHLIWIAGICGKLKSDFRYSNTLGWHTFPIPKLSEQDKTDLAAASERILEVREGHFPKTIAELYDPEKTPPDLRAAHLTNDEVVERIFAGRVFRNDTERLEHLFKRYARTIEQEKAAKGAKPAKRKAEKKEAVNG